MLTLLVHGRERETEYVQKCNLLKVRPVYASAPLSATASVSISVSLFVCDDMRACINGCYEQVSDMCVNRHFSQIPNTTYF